MNDSDAPGLEMRSKIASQGELRLWLEDVRLPPSTVAVDFGYLSAKIRGGFACRTFKHTGVGVN